MALIEHEVPEHDLVRMLELKGENLEIVEVEVDDKSPCLGRIAEGLRLPEGVRLISVVRDGKAHLAEGDTSIEKGDQLLAILQPGQEPELRKVLLGR
jgi:Trk K+ transport system NAD-binding subunit